MPLRTIPEIAEELRQHCNNDNDAPRLIAEHIFPLLKIDLSPKELKDVQEDNDDLRETLKDGFVFSGNIICQCNHWCSFL